MKTIVCAVTTPSVSNGPGFPMTMIPTPTCQYEPRPGGSRAGVPGPQNHQQPLPLMQQQAQCSQMGPTPIALAGASCMPMFPPGLGQQFFYGQAQPTFIPPQPGFGHQYQLVQPGQLRPRPGGSRAGVPGQQIQQQMVPIGPMSHHAPMSYRYDAGNVMQLSDAGGSSALANAFPTEQRNMLDDNLYPLTEQDTTEVLHWLELP
ncbi:polyadenylate-binding protein 2 isoform X3 [Helianthus annuus]|uniref:polyadenylate-binding protein 2 isoform X3 n=1 Tax=Helianthus annuus TaxID=4232 RepID=UPI001652E246|nr:polyadenylate-binding protein 2 isoform X3 [Helianthus annuus]